MMSRRTTSPINKEEKHKMEDEESHHHEARSSREESPQSRTREADEHDQDDEPQARRRRLAEVWKEVHFGKRDHQEFDGKGIVGLWEREKSGSSQKRSRRRSASCLQVRES